MTATYIWLQFEVSFIYLIGEYFYIQEIEQVFHIESEYACSKVGN